MEPGSPALMVNVAEAVPEYLPAPVTVTVAVPRPEEVNPKLVAECLPIGSAEVRAVNGGLHLPGLYLPQFGDKDDSIEVAVAAVEVEIPERNAVLK